MSTSEAISIDSPTKVNENTSNVVDTLTTIKSAKTNPKQGKNNLTDKESKTVKSLTASGSQKNTPNNKKVTQQSSNKRKQRPKKSQQDIIEEQSMPTTRLAGFQKTIRIKFSYTSDIIHQYLQLNQSTMLSAYERLAALLRMVSKDKPLSQHVDEWIKTNSEISSKQLEELQAQRQTLEDNMDDIELPEIIIPESYNTVFEASHPIVHKMIAISRAVDIELSACENLYHAGQLTDYEYARLRDQSTSIIRGSVDRIFKATKPGVRKGGRFSPQDLAQWIRDGNKLMFVDLPLQYQHIINDGDSTTESEAATESEPTLEPTNE